MHGRTLSLPHCLCHILNLLLFAFREPKRIRCGYGCQQTLVWHCFSVSLQNCMCMCVQVHMWMCVVCLYLVFISSIYFYEYYFTIKTFNFSFSVYKCSHFCKDVISLAKKLPKVPVKPPRFFPLNFERISSKSNEFMNVFNQIHF